MKTRGGPGPPLGEAAVATLERRRELELAADDLGLYRVHLGLIACGTAGLILPTPMPPFFRLKTRSVPPSNLPSLTCWIAWKTPLSTRLTPLVSTRLPSAYWSTSTPMPQMPAPRRRLERAEAAAAGDLEQHLRALRDLVLGDRLALVGRDEVLRVADEHLRAGYGLLRAELVARDPDVDRRDLQAADGTDRSARRPSAAIFAARYADEAAGLVRRVGQALDVRSGLPFCRRTARSTGSR